MYKGFGVYRSETPIDRHKRIQRHRPYVQCRKYEAVKHVTEELPIPEVKEEITGKPETGEVTVNAEEKTVKSKKQIRKEKKEALLDMQARQPHSSFLQLIFDPIGSVRRSCESAFVEYTMIGCFLASLLKWIIIGGMIAYVIGMEINVHAYSYAYLSFSSLAVLAMKLGLVGTACELAVFVIAGAVSRLCGKNTGFTALYDTHTHGTLSVIVLSLLCCLILFNVSGLSYGAALIPVIVTVLLDIYMFVRYAGGISVSLIAYGVSFAASCAVYMLGYTEITASLSSITRLFNM